VKLGRAIGLALGAAFTFQLPTTYPLDIGVANSRRGAERRLWPNERSVVPAWRGREYLTPVWPVFVHARVLQVLSSACRVDKLWVIESGFTPARVPKTQVPRLSRTIVQPRRHKASARLIR
jgi:hypothetical protein